MIVYIISTFYIYFQTVISWKMKVVNHRKLSGKNKHRSRRYDGTKILEWLTTQRVNVLAPRPNTFLLTELQFRSIIQSDDGGFIKKTARCFNTNDYSDMVKQLKTYIEKRQHQDLLPQTFKSIPPEIINFLKNNLEKTNAFLKTQIGYLIQPIVMQNYIQKYHKIKFNILKLSRQLNVINLKMISHIHDVLTFQLLSLQKRQLEFKIAKEQNMLYFYICKFCEQDHILDTINKLALLQTTIIQTFCDKVNKL